MSQFGKLASKVAHAAESVTEKFLLHPMVSTALIILFVLYGSLVMPQIRTNKLQAENLPSFMTSSWFTYVYRAVGLTVIAIVLAADVRVGVMLAVLFVLFYLVLHMEVFKVQILNFTQEHMTGRRTPIGAQYSKVMYRENMTDGDAEQPAGALEQTVAELSAESLQEIQRGIDQLAVDIEIAAREKSAMGLLSEAEKAEVQKAIETARSIGSRNPSVQEMRSLLSDLDTFHKMLLARQAPPSASMGAQPQDLSNEVIEAKPADKGTAASSIPVSTQTDAHVVTEAPRMGDKLVVEDGNGQPAMSTKNEMAVATPVIATTESGEVAKDHLNQEILTVPVQAVNQHGQLAHDAQGKPVVAPVVVKQDKHGNLRRTSRGDLLATRCKVMCDTSGVWIMRGGVLAPMDSFMPYSNDSYAPAM